MPKAKVGDRIRIIDIDPAEPDTDVKIGEIYTVFGIGENNRILIEHGVAKFYVLEHEYELVVDNDPNQVIMNAITGQEISPERFRAAFDLET